MLYQEKCQFRDRLIATTPYYPECLSLIEIQDRLRHKYNLNVDRQMIARHLKSAIRQGYLSHMGARRYTRPRTPEDRKAARLWERPKPTHPYVRANSDRARQLQEANAAIRAQLLKGTSPGESPSLDQNAP
jgi:hypothetical protein